MTTVRLVTIGTWRFLGATSPAAPVSAAEANTTYGKIGVKVWIYKGEVLPEVRRTAAGKGGE
jgi:ribosomal protein S3